MAHGATQHDQFPKTDVCDTEHSMQRTIVFGKGQVAHSRLPKADHGHTWRRHVCPLMGLHP